MRYESLPMRPIAPLLLALALAACGDASGTSDVATPDGVDDATTPADATDAADTAGDATPDGDATQPPGCVIPADAAAPEATPYLQDLGCPADFQALSSEPLDASIPGARALKTVYDRVGGQKLYFQNAKLFGIHYEFCAAFLSGHGLPLVPDLSLFNSTEYYTPSRRFILGAVTYYEGPKVWVYEISPYDTASAAMVETAFDAIRDHAFFGVDLRFHPTSEAVEKVAAALPADIPVITTDELFAGIDYQPLNLATGTGKLRFIHTADLEDGTEVLNYRDIVVLDFVPNDIAVAAGIITDQLQTQLAHVNVLSQNRGTPNMGLRGAFQNEALRALEGKWVELRVGAFDWTVHEITQAEADAWWEEHRPKVVQVPAMDLSKADIVSIDDIVGEPADLGAAIDAAIPAFGGKATHYSALRHVTVAHPGAADEPLPIEPALGVPVYFYDRFMRDNGLYDVADAMMADADFKGDARIRKARLEAFQAQVMAAPVDPAFLDELTERLEDLPRQRVRFRSSTNAEDLDGFTGAGLYTSATGDPYDPDKPVDVAVKTVWASVWRFKAFEEREYRGISHHNVGMALLVSPSFPSELSNGVAVTANYFSPDGSEPGFVVNVQKGDISIVLPPAGVTSDYFVYYWYYPGQPATYLSHSNLIGADQTVLTRAQAYRLGQVLDAIHAHFAPVYQHPSQFYGMDVEFKFDQPDGQEEPDVMIKQARPHPGWGLE